MRVGGGGGWGLGMLLVVHEVGFVSSAFELRRGVCQSESRVDDCRRYALLAAVWHKQLQLMLRD